MLRELLYIVPLCLVMQTAFAEHDPGLHTEIVVDPEPNWETATYACPLSIKTTKGEFRFNGARVFHAGDPLAELRGAPKKYIPFRFQETEEIDIACGYEGFNTTLIMQLTGLTACGGSDKPFLRMVCWTTDPYAGRK